MRLKDTLKRWLLRPLLWIVRRINSGHYDYRTVRRGVARLDRWLSVEFSGLNRTTVELADCTATWFDLAATPAGHVILYIHGGGFIFETPGLHSELLARLCNATATRGLMLNYRLAPESPYPAATDDCLAAYRYLLAAGYPAEKIIIAGDSAGGNLTLVSLLRIREAGLPLPAGAVALSPLTDSTGGSDSFRRNEKHDPMFNVGSYNLVMDNYLADATRRVEPWASPLFGELDGLPPVHLVVGSSEMLLDDSVRFAIKCPSATLEVWHDMPHVFPAMSFLPEAQEVMTRLASRIATMYAGSRVDPVYKGLDPAQQ